MSERWARAALQAYRWVGVGAYPFMGSYVALRASRGKEQHARRHERYGKASIERPTGPLAWVHAVSVGETGAVLGLVERMRERGINVVLTTGTTTSAALAAERLGDEVIHQYVPLDLKPAVSRFLNYWKPDVAIFAESEIWPMTILELGARRIPQILINGRMSDRSFVRWQKRVALAESLFENLSHVAAQTEQDAERFLALGARPVTVTGNLKADVVLPPVGAEAQAKMQVAIKGRKVWAAISTHEGEELIAARVHKALKKQFPDLLTIIVPRHPRRTADVHGMLEQQGMVVALRSVHGFPAKSTDVFLGDTIGEMGLYLRMANVAFVGKSLTGGGGQNPLEPAVLDTAILSGPNVDAFSEAYGKLVEARGARFVEDEAELTKALKHLFDNEKLRKGMAQAAARVVGDMEGALDKTWDMLGPFVQPLIVEAGLNGINRRDPENESPVNGNGRARIGWT